MDAKRDFRRVTFGRRLDVKRLRAVLRRAMREMAKDPMSGAAPTRLESVLIEPGDTTVYLSGNGPGLDAVARVVRSDFTGARVSGARRADAKRPPSGLRGAARR